MKLAPSSNQFEWTQHIRASTISDWPDNIIITDEEGLGHAAAADKNTIVVGNGAAATQILECIISRGTRHFIQPTFPTDSIETFDEMVQLSGLMLADPARFTANPLESYFSTRLPRKSQELATDNTYNYKKICFRNSKEKNRILSEVDEIVRSIPGSRAICEAVYLITDELVTNSLFNAPTDSLGRRHYAPLDRKTLVELDPQHNACIFLGWDNQVLFMGAEDTYGSLEPYAVLQRMAAAYQKGAANVISAQANGGGAGIGCYLMMEYASSYFLCVTPRQKTVVAAVLPLGLSSRRAFSLPKNLHVIA